MIQYQSMERSCVYPVFVCIACASAQIHYVIYCFILFYNATPQQVSIHKITNRLRAV